MRCHSFRGILRGLSVLFRRPGRFSDSSLLRNEHIVVLARRERCACLLLRERFTARKKLVQLLAHPRESVPYRVRCGDRAARDPHELERDVNDKCERGLERFEQLAPR